jgi:hypothetical protein
MINWSLDLFVSFILLGLTEALVKPAATYWARKNIIKWTPVALSYVDQILPDFVLSEATVDLDRLVRDKLSAVTGEDWSNKNIDYFWHVYDPRVTLSKLNSQKRAG